MVEMVNIADLEDPNDPQGRTFREVNNSTTHSFAVGDLVELSNGARLFVSKRTRDCDGTPLYSLSADNEDLDSCVYGYSEDGIKAV